MKSLYFLAMAILGTGLSYAEPLECGNDSSQCCWVIRSFQLLQGSDTFASDQFSWNFDSDEACCYISGVRCERSKNDTIIVKSL